MHSKKVEVLQSEHFWEKQKDGYAILSLLSNPSDWEYILQYISSSICTNLATDTSIEILDIGAGTGANTRRIMQNALSKHGVTANSYMVEPDLKARMLGDLFFSNGIPIGKGVFFSDISDLEVDKKFDAVLMMHSTYYMEDAGKSIKKVYDELIKNRGRIIILAMSKYSPFFLSGTPFRNCAEDIIECVSSMHLPYHSQKLPSKLAVPNGFWDDFGVVERISTTLNIRNPTPQIIQRLLRTHLRDGVDLIDYVITIGDVNA